MIGSVTYVRTHYYIKHDKRSQLSVTMIYNHDIIESMSHRKVESCTHREGKSTWHQSVRPQ